MNKIAQIIYGKTNSKAGYSFISNINEENAMYKVFGNTIISYISKYFKSSTVRNVQFFIYHYDFNGQFFVYLGRYYSNYNTSIEERTYMTIHTNVIEIKNDDSLYYKSFFENQIIEFLDKDNTRLIKPSVKSKKKGKYTDNILKILVLAFLNKKRAHILFPNTETLKKDPKFCAIWEEDVVNEIIIALDTLPLSLKKILIVHLNCVERYWEKTLVISSPKSKVISNYDYNYESPTTDSETFVHDVKMECQLNEPEKDVLNFILDYEHSESYFSTISKLSENFYVEPKSIFDHFNKLEYKFKTESLYNELKKEKIISETDSDYYNYLYQTIDKNSTRVLYNLLINQYLSNKFKKEDFEKVYALNELETSINVSDIIQYDEFISQLEKDVLSNNEIDYDKYASLLKKVIHNTNNESKNVKETVVNKTLNKSFKDTKDLYRALNFLNSNKEINLSEFIKKNTFKLNVNTLILKQFPNNIINQLSDETIYQNLENIEQLLQWQNHLNTNKWQHLFEECIKDQKWFNELVIHKKFVLNTIKNLPYKITTSKFIKYYLENHKIDKESVAYLNKMNKYSEFEIKVNEKIKENILKSIL